MWCKWLLDYYQSRLNVRVKFDCNLMDEMKRWPTKVVVESWTLIIICLPRKRFKSQISAFEIQFVDCVFLLQMLSIAFFGEKVSFNFPFIARTCYDDNWHDWTLFSFLCYFSPVFMKNWFIVCRNESDLIKKMVFCFRFVRSAQAITEARGIRGIHNKGNPIHIDFENEYTIHGYVDCKCGLIFQRND